MTENNQEIEVEVTKEEQLVEMEMAFIQDVIHSNLDYKNINAVHQRHFSSVLNIMVQVFNNKLLKQVTNQNDISYNVRLFNSALINLAAQNILLTVPHIELEQPDVSLPEYDTFKRIGSVLPYMQMSAIQMDVLNEDGNIVKDSINMFINPFHPLYFHIVDMDIKYLNLLEWLGVNTTENVNSESLQPTTETIDVLKQDYDESFVDKERVSCYIHTRDKGLPTESNYVTFILFDRVFSAEILNQERIIELMKNDEYMKSIDSTEVVAIEMTASQFGLMIESLKCEQEIFSAQQSYVNESGGKLNFQKNDWVVNQTE